MAHEKSKHPRSIRREIVRPLIATFVVATLLLVAYVMNDSQKMVRQMLESLRIEMITLVKNDLSARLEEAVKLNRLNQNAVNSGILNLEDEANRERYFSGVLKEFDDVAMSYIGLPDGSFYGARRNLDGSIHIVMNNCKTGGSSQYYDIDESGRRRSLVQSVDNFDPRVRPWYKSATEVGDMTFSSIYSHFVVKEPTLTASLPIYRDGELYGVLGVDYLMTWLSGTLKELPIGANGQVFIVDEKGQLVASTTGESIFKLVDGKSQNIMAQDSASPITQKVMTLTSRELEEKLPEILLDQQLYLIGQDALDFYGVHWQIFTVLREDDFLGDMRLMIIRTIIGAAGIIGVFILMVIIVTRSILQPISRLNDGAKQLSKGIYVAIPLEKRQDELYELTVSFNEMGRRIINHVEELAAEVRLRTVELEEKNAILNQMSYTDELMEIANRRKFDEFFEQALDLAARSAASIGLIMMDIDNFKAYNDTYGHTEGDECLKAIGHTLKNHVHRKTDLVARYGGEEIVVVVQDADCSFMTKIADDLRQAVFELKIPHQKSEYGVVTISSGVVCGTVGRKQCREEIISLADANLYRAKSEGKNRVVMTKLNE